MPEAISAAEMQREPAPKLAPLYRVLQRASPRKSTENHHNLCVLCVSNMKIAAVLTTEHTQDTEKKRGSGNTSV